MRLLPGCLPKASDLMASVSPQRCSPQLVVKFKSCRQHSAHLPRQMSSIRRKVTALSICQRAFYRGLPFAQRSHGPPLTCEQSRQADLQPRLAAGLHAHPQRPWGKSLAFRLCLTLPPLTYCPRGWTFHLSFTRRCQQEHLLICATNG